jgi:hypothetical protein
VSTYLPAGVAPQTSIWGFRYFRRFRRWFLVKQRRVVASHGGTCQELAQLAQLAQAILGDGKRWWPKRWSPAGVSTVVIAGGVTPPWSEVPVLSEAEGKNLVAACNWREIPSTTVSAGLRFSADQIRATQDDGEENAHVPILFS